MILGVDVGTTNVKVALVEPSHCWVIEEHSEPLNASLPSSVEGKDEQHVGRILASLDKVMQKFPLESKKKVVAVGVSGQMHGIVLWNSDLHFGSILRSPDSCSSDNISPLITWRDGRCSDEFLSTLPNSSSSKPVSTGYGCCTLFWLQRFYPHLLKTFNCCGTIMDLVVCLLCGHRDVTMSNHNANSWGYFNTTGNCWEMEILNTAGFPVHLLPKIVSPPAVAGPLIESWHGIPAGIPVGVAMGDLQCGVHSVQPDLRQAVLNIGTASQLSVVKPHDCNIELKTHPSLMEVPYFGNSTLIVAASLNGGNILNILVELFQELLQHLDVSKSKDELYSVLFKAGERKPNTTLQIRPVLLGERHDPTKRGTAYNIATDNTSLGDIVSSVSRGIVQNLEDMMPKQAMESLKVNQLIGSGSTLHRNTVLVEHAKKVFGLPLTLKQDADAPLGAAIAISELIDIIIK